VRFGRDRFVKSHFSTSSRMCNAEVVKVATCLSQRNGTRGAVNQFGAELILEGRDLFADGWFDQFTFLGRRRRNSLSQWTRTNICHCIQFVHTSPLFLYGMDAMRGSKRFFRFYCLM